MRIHYYLNAIPHVWCHRPNNRLSCLRCCTRICCQGSPADPELGMFGVVFLFSIKFSPWRRSSPDEVSPKETRRKAGKAQSATSSVFVVGSLGNPNKTCKCEIWMICKNIPLGLRLKCNNKSMIQRRCKSKKWLTIKKRQSFVMLLWLLRWL